MNAFQLSERLTRWLSRGEGHWSPPEEARLAKAVAELSELYTRRREALTKEVPGRAHSMARLHFFLPRDAGKVTHALEALSEEVLAPRARCPRLLDLGAGLGTSTLGAAAYFEGTPETRELSVEAWDTDPVALSIMRHVTDHATQLGLPPISLETHAGSLAHAPRGARYDLILMGLVLNELSFDLEARAELLRGLCQHLAPGGVLLVVEPALRASSRALMEVRDRLAATPAAPHVLGPCLHHAPCPLMSRARDWCHAELRGELQPPLARVAAAAGLRQSRLTYAWLALGSEPPSGSSRGARVVSGPLRSKGKLELDLCHAGGQTRLMRLERERCADNDAMDALGRGDRLWLRGAEWSAGRLRLRPGMSVTTDAPTPGGDRSE
ncbi:MAG: methyltransferase domain-containing protein [Deltaproteobacteria bacterium]|nr:methyltransferase domain-containing protein [Deltaproteobacteria bacterium]